MSLTYLSSNNSHPHAVFWVSRYTIVRKPSNNNCIEKYILFIKRNIC